MALSNLCIGILENTIDTQSVRKLLICYESDKLNAVYTTSRHKILF